MDLTEPIGWQNGPATRGALAIIWSYLSTVIICTWTILHLNVPSLGHGFWKRTFRKIKWMTITLFFPEFILAQAVVELKVALEDLEAMYQKRDMLVRNGWQVTFDLWSRRPHALVNNSLWLRPGSRKGKGKEVDRGGQDHSLRYSVQTDHEQTGIFPKPQANVLAGDNDGENCEDECNNKNSIPLYECDSQAMAENLKDHAGNTLSVIPAADHPYKWTRTHSTSETWVASSYPRPVPRQAKKCSLRSPQCWF